MFYRLNHANGLVGLLLIAFLAAAACGESEEEGKTAVRKENPGPSEVVTRPVEARSRPETGRMVAGSGPAEPEGSEEPGRDRSRPVTFEEAESTYFDGRYDEALELFTGYVEHRPGNPWGQYMRGLSAWKAGRLDVAETALTRALELDTSHVKSHLNLARVLLERDRAEQALDHVERALQIAPTSGVAYRLLGRVRNEIGQVGAAISAYRQAIRLDERDVWSMNNLGLIYIRAGRFQEALAPLARAIELRDDVAVFFNNLGIALERTGHPGAAAEAFRRALELDEGYEKAAFSLARLEERGEAGPAAFDVGVLARSFRERVDRWQGESPAEEVTVQLDSLRMESGGSPSERSSDDSASEDGPREGTR